MWYIGRTSRNCHCSCKIDNRENLFYEWRSLFYIKEMNKPLMSCFLLELSNYFLGRNETQRYLIHWVIFGLWWAVWTQQSKKENIPSNTMILKFHFFLHSPRLHSHCCPWVKVYTNWWCKVLRKKTKSLVSFFPESDMYECW